MGLSLAKNVTALSAGQVIRDLLTGTPPIMQLATAVFPVVTAEATLPYIAFRRSKLITRSSASGGGSVSADTVEMELAVYSQEYAEGLKLAELVRETLDNKQVKSADLTMRACVLTDAAESFDGDAYIQQLTFTIKI